jgi:kynurenine formamidase
MSRRVVDLTQTLGPTTALWPGSEPVERRVVVDHATHGLYGQVWRTPEHAGTHLDAPAHFDPAGARVDQIPAERLVVECAVLDVRDRCTDDADFTLEARDVRAIEARDTRIERGSAVLVYTGWDQHRDDPGRYLGGSSADELHFPGLGPSAAELLIERGVVGIGIDTAGVDPGHAVEAPVHHMTMPAGLWHLEGLVNLGELPARGSQLFVGALKLEEGSGAPARVLALVKNPR